jgi:hypothetical protein
VAMAVLKLLRREERKEEDGVLKVIVFLRSGFFFPLFLFPFFYFPFFNFPLF